MNESTERVIRALDLGGCRPRRSGRRWIAHCPTHPDKHPSLSIAEGSDGRALVYCHAGCRTEDILVALGLTLADLQPNNTPTSSRPRQKDVTPPPTKPPRRVDDTSWQNHPLVRTAQEVFDAVPLARICPEADQVFHDVVERFGRHPNDIWTYTDAEGNHVGYVCRWNQRTGKTIRPISRYPDGWKVAGMPSPRPLYRLPEILKSPSNEPIWVFEGEKTADAGWLCGLVSTCSAGGANAAQQTDWSPLRGRRVIICPDNDSAGEAYARDVTRLCLQIGARDVRLLRLVDLAPQLPPGGDLADVLQSADLCGLPLSEGVLPEDIGRYLLTAIEKSTPLPSASTNITQHAPNATRDSKQILRFHVAPSTGKAKRMVVATLGDREIFRDSFDVNHARSRTRFGQELAEILGWNPQDVIRRCHDELPRLADQADKQIAFPLPSSTTEIVPPWPEPLPHPVSLADALQHAYDAIARYVVLSHNSAVAVSLWVAWTYVYDSGNVAPLLAIVSPVRRCGKTRLLTCIRYLAARSIPVSNISPAAIYRVIQRYAPLTLLIDEVDTFLNNEELRGIINAGHTRELAYVVRNVPSPDGTYEPQRFSVWCPKALASIGWGFPTWHDRAITIRMERKRKDDVVERIDAEYLKHVARELFTAVVTDEIRNAVAENVPSCPDCLHDRAADNWQPLLAIAHSAGGKWWEWTWQAAIALSCVEEIDTEELPARLLRDCILIFEDDETLTAGELAQRLGRLDDSPWPTYNHGRPISPEQVGRMLRRFGLKPHKGHTANYYYRNDIMSMAIQYSLFSDTLPE